MTSAQRRKLVAVRCRIADILNGKYVKRDDLTPGYVLTSFGLMMSRVRIGGIVSQVYSNEDRTYGFITIEDGTGSIRIKFFNESVKLLDGINKGDWIEAVGRIREYNEERYVVVDGIEKHDDPLKSMLFRMDVIKSLKKFMEKRKAVLDLMKKASDLEELLKLAEEKGLDGQIVEGVWQAENVKKEEEEIKKGEEIEKEEAKDLVLRLIKENDEGSGVEYSTIVGKAGLPEHVVESVIDELLAEGTCYEPKPGRIRLV